MLLEWPQKVLDDISNLILENKAPILNIDYNVLLIYSLLGQMIQYPNSYFNCLSSYKNSALSVSSNSLLSLIKLY